MTQFLGVIWGNDPSLFGEIRTPSLRSEPQRWFPLTPEGLRQAGEYALQLDRGGHDTYYGVMPRLRHGGTVADCRAWTDVLWADVDTKVHADSKRAALAALGRAHLEPSVLVDSGHGWHAYWLLTEAVAVEDAQAAMKGLATAIGGDRVWDAARILRLPGTRNWKSDPPLPVRLLRFAPKRRYQFGSFADLIAPPEPVKHYEPRETDGWQLSSTDAPKFPEGERNNQLARLGGIMVVKGLTPDEVEMNLLAENQIRCSPPLSDREVIAIAKSLRRYA